MMAPIMPPPTLTKSDYLRFLQCPRYLWLWHHRRDDVEDRIDPARDWLFEEGDLVEGYARSLFPSAILVQSFHEQGARDTRAFIEDGERCLFQATAQADGLLAMADVFRFNPEAEAWDIFEVKSGTSVTDEYLHDVCFQKIAFERAGYSVGTLSLVHINSDYVRRGGIDPAQLFAIEDVTEAVRAIEAEVSAGILRAKEALACADLPLRDRFPCSCSPKDGPCPAHCFPDLPDYSVYFLSGMRRDKARTLYESGIRSILDVPADLPLTDAQCDQVLAAKRGTPLINAAAIRAILDTLTYPLSFLDYETFYPALPFFDGLRPYQQMPFQFSLHVLPAPGAPLEHHAFLAKDFANTMPAFACALRTHLPERGTVIVWNKGFETGRNKEMAKLLPQYEPFLTSVNARVFDLMEIFRKQHYVHAGFRGSCSIKKVLPVLLPALSYKDLEIQDGSTASLAWYRMVTSEGPEAEKACTYRNLLDYCCLDTRAMVEIFRHLETCSAVREATGGRMELLQNLQ